MWNGCDCDVALAHVPTTAIWREPADYTAEQLAITDWPLLSAILLSRGITTRAEARAFLDTASFQLGDPLLLPDMDRAVALIRRTLAGGGRIGIFGDYDVDGLSTTAMMTRALTRLGADPLPVIPHRKRDGYGLNPDAVERFASEGVELLIVVDCGSGNRREIEAALQRGIEVIVLDHHQTHGELPEPVPFVSPRREENRYPETELAAVGVAYTLLRALLGDAEAEMYLPYVALGTVADVVQLRNENRALVARGLDKLRRWQLPGFKSLCELAGIDRREIDAFAVGFIIGPRINAAGRMDTPDIALKWFLADDMETAIPFSQQLDQINRARQEETRRILAEAEQQITAAGGAERLPAIIVDSEDWSIGVAGIVAGRLAEAYHRPAFVIERGPEMSKGSARSSGRVDLVKVLRRSDELLEYYGGHAAAAGMTLRSENIERFREAASAAVLDLLGGMPPRREIVLDAVVDHLDLHLDTVDALQVLEPFGHGNKPPRLLARDLRPVNVRTSRDGRHLLFEVLDRHDRRHKAVFFGAGARQAELLASRRIDAAVALRRDAWNGHEQLQLRFEDFRPAR